MVEMPLDERITLDDLQKTNQILVTSGASIFEMRIRPRDVGPLGAGVRTEAWDFEAHQHLAATHRIALRFRNLGNACRFRRGDHQVRGRCR